MKVKISAILFLSFAILVSFGLIYQRSAAALDEETSKRYATNNIVFYNPNGASGPCPEAYPLKPGGLSKSEADQFIAVYKRSEGCAQELGITTSCRYGYLANCVGMSKFFINRYTTRRVGAVGNGKDVAKNSGFPTGTAPRAYAIFSTDSGNMECPPGSGNKCGHTGVVLGISGNTVYTAEAFCGSPLSAAKIISYPMSKMTSGAYTFAYTDGYIKFGNGE